MAKADKKTTTCRTYFGEEARARLRAHIERVYHRRKGTRDVDWDELWQVLESAAKLYERWAADPEAGPRKTLEALAGCVATLDKLRGQLTDPSLLNWSVVSAAGWSFKAESPEQSLAQKLAEQRNRFEADIEELQILVRGTREKKAPAKTWLVRTLAGVGHWLFGAGVVGREDGPLVTFLQLALEPVLGNATPPAATLRTIARQAE
jgi:hypothetical protein